MNQKPKTARNPKTQSPVQIGDLNTKKDPKGGIIAILTDLNTSSPPPKPPPPPPTIK
jgi:hypothetical protein